MRARLSGECIPWRPATVPLCLVGDNLNSGLRVSKVLDVTAWSSDGKEVTLRAAPLSFWMYIPVWMWCLKPAIPGGFILSFNIKS